MATYHLSAQLAAHSDDIKCVLPVNDDVLLSASRDKTVGVWYRNADDARKFDLKRILAGHEGYVNALECIPSDEDCKLDLIASAGNAGVILLHHFNLDAASREELPPEPLAALQGHHANVCALSYSPKRRKLMSASWDCAARVWSREKYSPVASDGKDIGIASKAGEWRCEAVLAGHNAAVWGVSVIEDGPNAGCYLTGAADSLVKAWDSDGQLLRSFPKFPDMIRSMSMLRSGEKFAVASNDGSVRVVNLKGKVTETLSGHEDYVYHVTTRQDDTLLACGEDHTARIWAPSPGPPDRSTFNAAAASLDYGLTQTLMHPCQTVWCGSWFPNGDVVSGGSDNIIRIFSADEQRKAVGQEAEEYEASMLELQSRKSKATTQSVGGTSPEPAEMTLDIDIEDDKPPLQLTFNRHSDPQSIAATFSIEHGLSDNYRQQIQEFLESHKVQVEQVE